MYFICLLLSPVAQKRPLPFLYRLMYFIKIKVIISIKLQSFTKVYGYIHLRSYIQTEVFQVVSSYPLTDHT